MLLARELAQVLVVSAHEVCGHFCDFLRGGRGLFYCSKRNDFAARINADFHAVSRSDVQFSGRFFGNSNGERVSYNDDFLGHKRCNGNIWLLERNYNGCSGIVNPVVNFGDGPRPRLRRAAKIYYGVNRTAHDCYCTCTKQGEWRSELA